MGVRRQIFQVQSGTATIADPSGTTIPTGAVPIPDNCVEVHIDARLSLIGTPDVDIEMWVLPNFVGAVWHEETRMIIENLEDQPADQITYQVEGARAYKYIFPCFKLNSSTATCVIQAGVVTNT